MPASSSTHLSSAQRLLRMLSQYRRELSYVILYAIVAGLISLSLPLGVQAIIGLISGGAMSASWAVLVLFVTVGALMVGLLRLMQLSIMEHLQRRIFTAAAVEFAVRIPRFDLLALRREHLPELVNRFFDTLTIQKGLPKIIIEGSTAVLQVILCLLLLSFYHPTFVTFSLLLLGALALLFWWTAPLGLESSLTESKYKYKLAYWLEELGRVAATFKLAGENNFALRRADALTVGYLDARARHWRILVIQFVSSIVFRVAALAGFLVLGSLLVMENQLNLGQFVASEILILFVIESVEKLIRLHETGYDLLTATEKLGQVTDLPLEREDGIRVEDFAADQSLALETRDLSYTYPGQTMAAIKSLNISIKGGECVAVAGYNGSGKSTLMQIFSLLTLDYQGTLLVNGLPETSLHRRSLHDHIGDMSSQEEIFKGTIRENIALDRPDVTVQRMLQVAEALGLANFLRDLPGGMEAELLPGGKNLPRSVVMKILLARAIVTQPKLLVLEDPLNNLIFHDRLRIARYLTDRSHPWTLITTTSDSLMASLCDRVLVFRDGAIVFDGPFDALQATEHYARLFRTYEDTINPAPSFPS